MMRLYALIFALLAFGCTLDETQLWPDRFPGESQPQWPGIDN